MFRKINICTDQAIRRLARHLNHARRDRTHCRNKSTAQARLTRLANGRWHTQTFVGIDRHGDIRISRFDVGECNPEVSLAEWEFLFSHFFIAVVELFEFELNRRLRSVAIGVVLCQERHALGLGNVGNVVGNDRTVLRIRTVESNREGITFSGQDRIGLRNGRDVEHTCPR